MNITYLIIYTIPLFLLLVQLIIALNANRTLSNAASRFAKGLSSQTTGVELLEKYSRIYSKVNISVNPNIGLPAIAEKETLLVKRANAYDKTLYINIYILLEVILTDKKYWENQSYFAQKFFFFVQLVLYGFLILFPNIVIVILFMIISLGLIVSGYYRQESFKVPAKRVIDVAKDLLDLDETEQSEAQKLLQILGQRYHLYSVNTLISIIHFLGF